MMILNNYNEEHNDTAEAETSNPSSIDENMNTSKNHNNAGWQRNINFDYND